MKKTLKALLSVMMVACVLLGSVAQAETPAAELVPEKKIAIMTTAAQARLKNVVADTKAAKMMSRGSVIDLWLWNSGSDAYYLKNGKAYNGCRFYYYGTLKAKVTKGKAWLKAVKEYGAWYPVIKKNNTKNKTRDGQIKLTDSKGTVLTVNYRQCGLLKVNGSSINGSAVTIKAKKPTKTTGFAVYSSVDGYTTPVMTTKSSVKISAASLGLSAFQPGVHYYFCVAPYVKLGKKKLIGPTAVVLDLVY